jgi:hypothetical protein
MNWKDYEEIAQTVKKNTKKENVESRDIHEDGDYIWAPEKGMATFIYILVMIFVAIFEARILLWIIATLIYFGHYCNHDTK